MSTYVMSDIHGEKKAFDKMLKTIHFSNDDTLYIIGDIIDRGPEPIDLMLEIMGMENVHCLLGNHEKLMLNGLTKGAGDALLWFKNGGLITYEKFIKLDPQLQHIVTRFIYAMPLTKELVVGGNRFCLAHGAYIKCSFMAPEKMEEAILWSRDILTVEGSTVITGHTPTRRRRIADDYRMYKARGYYCIDCGCATNSKNKLLGCLRLDDLTEYYVKVYPR